MLSDQEDEMSLEDQPPEVELYIWAYFNIHYFTERFLARTARFTAHSHRILSGPADRCQLRSVSPVLRHIYD
jgi:hypothetical protein